MSILQTDQNGGSIQGFAPNRIVSVSAGASLDVTDVLAVRVNANAAYKINDAGTEGTMPTGVTVIRKGVTSLQFTSATVVEVMD